MATRTTLTIKSVLTLASIFAFFGTTALAQEADSPLSLSFASSLKNLPQPESEISPQPVLQSGDEALTVVEIDSPPRIPGAIDLTTEPDDLIERLRNGFSMPNINNDLVLYHQQWYLNRPDYLRRMVERSSRYLHHIVAELNKRGMPTELALLPMVESAYNPMAYSRSHASGLWQFIPSTGKQYKLEQNWWKDGRRDIVASTSAALDYLQYIYEMHGDWHLALASYNWGEGSVGRAIEKNKAKGLPTDYLSLTMPAETKNYVPKLQALKNIFSNPKLLSDIGLRVVPNRPYFSTIVQSSNIDVKVAAKLAEMPVAEFVALNPAHNRPVIKPDTPLVIPADKVDTFMSNLESHQNSDKPLSSWQSYTLRPGEKLEKVAPRFGMTVANLKAVNGLNGRLKLAPGLTLLVAGNDAGESADMAALPEQPRLPSADPAPASPSRTHTVQRGETLARLAKRYSLSVADLKRLNHLRSDNVAPGTKLTVAAPGKTSIAKGERKTVKIEAVASKSSSKTKKTPKVTHYTVRRNDTLASIARQLKVEKSDILRWNRISPNALPVGKTLRIERAQND
jgi:membrane-bound lytic murein transglycosylase D